MQKTMGTLALTVILGLIVLLAFGNREKTNAGHVLTGPNTGQMELNFLEVNQGRDMPSIKAPIQILP